MRIIRGRQGLHRQLSAERHLAHFALFHAAHHALHHFAAACSNCFSSRFDVLHGGAAAGGDAALAAGAFRMSGLRRSMRVMDRMMAAFFFCALVILCLHRCPTSFDLLPRPGIIFSTSRDRTHLVQAGSNLFQIILQRERYSCASCGYEIHRPAFHRSLSCAFSISEQHIAHAQNAARHAVGVEGLHDRSAFRPRRQNLIGLPVTARTEIAAPPRVSPSSLVKITPSTAQTVH